MSLPIVFAPEAEEELSEAAEWYEQRAAGVGERLLAAVQSVLDVISITPSAFEIAHRDMRRGLVQGFPYSVIYRVHEDRVEVVAIFHNRRDQRIWQNRAQS